MAKQHTKVPTTKENINMLWKRVQTLETQSNYNAGRINQTSSRVTVIEDGQMQAKVGERLVALEKRAFPPQAQAQLHHTMIQSLDSMRRSVVGGSNIFQMAEEIRKQYKQDQLVELIKQLAAGLNV